MLPSAVVNASASARERISTGRGYSSTMDAAVALEHGYTLPWAWYADPDVHRLEQERIFGRAWQYAGRLDEVPRPGDHFTCRAGGLPILVTRNSSGGLEA